MASNANPDKVKTDSDNILNVWKANTDFKMKEVTLEDFEGGTKRLNTVLKDILTKDQELSILKNERDDLARKLNELCTRARSGMKGYFGPNSSQYEQAGGTRAIERKKPARNSGNAQSENK